MNDVKVVLSFNAAMDLYKKGHRVKCLDTGKTYIDYKMDGDNTKFSLKDIYGEWVLINE